MLSIPVLIKTHLAQIFAPSTYIATAIISIYHCYTTYNHRKLKRKSSCSTSLKLSFALIITAIFCHTALCLLLDSQISTLKFCAMVQYWGPPSYVIYKLLMYLILTIKAREYYHNSTFAYSPKKLRIWQCLLIIWSLLNAVLTIFLSTKSLSPDPNEVPQCQYVLYPPFIVSMISLDLIGGAGSAYLVIKPMLKTHKLKKKRIQNEGNVKLYTTEFKRIANKQAMLSGMTVITTWLGLIGVSLTAMHAVFISIDVLVSLLSVILMYSWNKRLYNVLCCCCAMKSKKLASDNDIKNIQIVMQNSNEPQATDKKDDNVDLETQPPMMEVASSASIATNDVVVD